jgi:putative tryptophan/tyrosine transport system substrate-binding protein
MSRPSIRARASLLVSAIVALGLVLAAFPESRAGTPVRIGRLSPLSAAADRPSLEAFREGLRELGWKDGADFTIEARYGEGKPARLPEIAADLVRRGVDLIVVGSTQGTLAAKKATSTIPIVMVTTGDPLEGRVVESLAHPGGNVTGVTALGEALSTKRLELIREAVPGVTRVAVLANPTSPYTQSFLRERDQAARALGIALSVVEVRDAAMLDDAFATMASERPGALLVLSDIMLIDQRRRIVALAAKHRLAAVYPEIEFVRAGGLMFYGASLAGMYRHAAVYAHKILKGGARPADLPIEQPTKLDLVINLRAAKALGMTLPPALLVRADRVID